MRIELANAREDLQASRSSYRLATAEMKQEFQLPQSLERGRSNRCVKGKQAVYAFGELLTDSKIPAPTGRKVHHPWRRRTQREQ
jgi:hypothetical protein